MKQLMVITATLGNNKIFFQSKSSCLIKYSFDELLDILSFLCGGGKTLNATWNLDFFTCKIASFFPEEKVIELSKETKCMIDNYSVFYIPDKVLSIRDMRTKNGASFYGIDQYYPDISENIEDVSKVYEMAHDVVAAFKKMNLRVDKLTSPIAVYESCVLKGMNIPTYKDIPFEANELAYKASGKLWVEAHKIGWYH